MKDKMPCINCITFAACKALYKQTLSQCSGMFDSIGDEMTLESTLRQKCSILKKWSGKPDASYMMTKCSNIFHRYYNME